VPNDGLLATAVGIGETEGCSRHRFRAKGPKPKIPRSRSVRLLGYGWLSSRHQLSREPGVGLGLGQRAANDRSIRRLGRRLLISAAIPDSGRFILKALEDRSLAPRNRATTLPLRVWPFMAGIDSQVSNNRSVWLWRHRRSRGFGVGTAADAQS